MLGTRVLGGGNHIMGFACSFNSWCSRCIGIESASHAVCSPCLFNEGWCKRFKTETEGTQSPEGTYLGKILGKGKQKYFRLMYSVFGFRPKA